MDTADAAGPSTNTSGGNIWDHAWTLDEIKKNAGNWSLAADVGLLKHMDEFSKRLTSRAHEVSSDVSQLVHDTRLTDCNIQSVTDYFLALSDSQFIENRVYDEDDSGSKDAKETTEPKEKTREEKEAEMLPRLKEALKYGLDVIEESYDVLDIKAGDSDIDSDDEEDLTPGELILEAKDPYVVRPLPHLIGSRAFYQDDDVGVGDLLGSDDGESEVGSLSESEDEIEKPASVSDVSTSEYSDDDMSDGGDGDAEVIPVKRRQTVSSDDVTSSDDEDLFDKPASDDSDDEEVQAKPRAESSISKSKPKPAKKKKQPEQDLFGQDEDAEDDLFAPTSGLFGGGKKSLFDAPSDGGLFEGADASFEDTTDESSEDDDTQQEVAPKPQEAKKSQKKLPTGGVSLFGGAIKKGFFHHGDASDESDASEEETPPKLDAPPQAKSSGGLFDQSDSDEDLFDEVQPKKKETPPVKRTPISTKSSPQIAAKPPVKSSLFDESDDDADDDEDLFKEAETEEKPKEVKSKKPVGGVSMFGAGGGGLQEALKKRRKDSSSTSESGGSHPVTQSSHEQASSLGNANANQKASTPRDNLKANQTASKPRQSLFSASDNDDDLFGEASKKANAKVKVQQPAKSKSLFDVSDSDEEDLFGAMTKAKPMTSNKLPASSSNSSLASQSSKASSRQNSDRKSFASEKDERLATKKKIPGNTVESRSRTSLAPQKAEPKPGEKKQIFDDDDDDDEDLFVSRKPLKTATKPKTKESKKAPAENREVRDNSLFGSTVKTSSKILSKTKDLFSSDEDDGLFSSKPPPVPSDDRDASKKSSAEKVTKGDGGLFKVSDSEDDDLFSNFKKPKKVIKPTVAPAKKPKEATAPPKSTTVSKTKQSGLFGSDSDDGDDGDLFSKPPPFTSKTGAAKKSAAASLFDDDDSDQAVADVKPAKKPAAKKALATSLFDDDDDDGDDAALDVKREEKSSEQKPTSDPLYGDDDSKDGDALDAVEDTKVEAPPQEEAPKKRLPGAVSMFGAGGNELLAAIQKKRSASQKSTSAPPVEAVSPPLDDAVNGTERSDKDVDAAGREATPKPTNLFEKTATKTANVTAKPFKPSSALSESKPIVSKVAAPNVTSGSSIGKLKTNLAINPAALLPGSAPIIKSSVDVDAPLESATKTRSRGQAGRRPPSRRARQKIAERASEEILSTSPFDDVSTNKPSQPAGKPHEVASKAKESNNDDFLDQLLSTSTAKSSKETSKSPQTKKKEPAKAPSLFGDDDDLFSAPSTVAKTTATKKNNLFDDSVSAADDLFDMAPKSTAGPRAKATPGGDDLFGDSPKASDSASKNSAKKIDLFGNDLFADGDDDLDFMKSPIAKSQRGDKTSAEAKKKKKTDLFADGDLFADDITFSKPTKKKTQPSKAPKDDFDDLFGDSSPTVTKKKSKKQASKQKTDDLFGGDDDDIFAASLSSSKKKTVKSSTKVDTGLDDVDDLFSSVPSSKKSTSKSKAKTSEPTDTDIFDDPLNALMS